MIAGQTRQMRKKSLEEAAKTAVVQNHERTGLPTRDAKPDSSELRNGQEEMCFFGDAVATNL